MMEAAFHIPQPLSISPSLPRFHPHVSKASFFKKIIIRFFQLQHRHPEASNEHTDTKNVWGPVPSIKPPD